MPAYLTRLSTLYRNWRIRRLEVRISKLRAKLLRLRLLSTVDPMGQAIGSIIGEAVGSFIAASSGDSVEMLPNGRVQAYAEDTRDDHGWSDDQE